MGRRNAALDRTQRQGHAVWAVRGWAPGASGSVLGGDRSRRIERERCGGGGGIAEHWCPVVPQGWRHAASHPRAGVRALSVFPGARGDRDLARSGFWGARLRVSSVAHRRRSPGSCNATPRCAPADPSTEPRPPKPMLTVARGVPGPPSSRSTQSCGAMSRTDSPGKCAGPTGASRFRKSVGGTRGRQKISTGIIHMFLLCCFVLFFLLC